MPIYCSIHNNRLATVLCDSCGFLCEDHAVIEGEQGHALLTINSKIKDLYNSIALINNVSMLFNSIASFKERLLSLLDSKQYNLQMQYQTAKTMTDTLSKDNAITRYHQIIKFMTNSIKLERFTYEPIFHNLFENIKVKLSEFDAIAGFTGMENRRPLHAIEQPLIHYWRGSDITIVNPIDKHKTTIKLNQKINDYADSISFGRRIFIIGGNLINDTYEVDIQNKALNQNQPMIVKKYYHSLCNTNGSIYSVGGYDTKYMADCEKYCASTNKWDQLPNLLVPRGYSAVFAFNNNSIYCFCGHTNNTGYTNLMEKLKFGGVGWEYVNVKCPFSKRCGVHGIQYNASQVIVFGSNHCTNDSYLLTMTGNTAECTLNSNLIEGYCFYCSSAPVVVDGYVYAVDYRRCIHKYGNNKWDMTIIDT